MATSDETQGQAQKPDSKDFVEHLRTVHFTLVTVCVGLFVIFQFPSPVSIREAIHQLNSIDDTLHVWKESWFSTDVQAAIRNEESAAPCFRPVTNEFDMMVSDKRVRFSFPSGNWYIKLPETSDITAYWDDADPGNSDSIVSAPKHLDKFKYIWDRSYLFVCPLYLANESIVTLESGERVIRPIKRLPLSSTGVSLTGFSVEDAALKDELDDFFLYKSQSSSAKGLFYEKGFFDSTNPNTGPEGVYNIAIPVTAVQSFNIDYRQILIKEMPQHHWLHADFKDAFHELDQATTGFQDLDFEHIRSILQQNEKNSKEAFQAFGITFPIETTTRWGTFIIIVIQFYFLLHFMEYNKRRTQAEPDVAWIGIYASPGARLLFCATALAVPVGVIVFVCVKAGLLPHMPIRNFILCSVVVGLSWLFSLLTAKEYFKKGTLTSTIPPRAAG